MTKKSFKNQKIWITSGRGMLGIALTNLFKKKKIKFISSNKDMLDLRKKTLVIKWLKKKKTGYNYTKCSFSWGNTSQFKI